jgi:hypothetical protein
MYRDALALPGKSVATTKGPYESAKDAALRGTIQRLAAAREIAGCSAYSNALVRARRTLDEFAAFDKEFREAENVYKKKPSDFSYRMLMVEFCPDNSSARITINGSSNTRTTWSRCGSTGYATEDPRSAGTGHLRHHAPCRIGTGCSPPPV